MTRNAEKIERKSHYNGKGMRETLSILLKQAHDAQTFINQKGKSQIKVVLKLFIHDISSLISQYISHVEYRVCYSIMKHTIHTNNLLIILFRNRLRTKSDVVSQSVVLTITQ